METGDSPLRSRGGPGGPAVTPLKTRPTGFTLIELLVVIGILSLLAGIVYAANAPARENARQTVCIGKLRAFGQAVAMYRADYDGQETGNWPKDFGLPRSLVHLRPAYLQGPDTIFQCPSANPWERQSMTDPTTGFWMLYVYGIWRDLSNFPPDSGVPTFGAAVALRGPDFPLVTCHQHRGRQMRMGQGGFLELILRWDGRVTRTRPPVSGPPWVF